MKGGTFDVSEEKLAEMQQTRTLRIIAPKLYEFITNELEKENIHSYDVQMKALQKEEGIHVFLWYGEKYNNQADAFFSHQVVEELGEEIEEFIKNVAESCKEIMLNEYFKMMKP